MAKVELVGPWGDCEVRVAGATVPYLRGYTRPGGGMHLSLNNTVGIELTAEQANIVVPFVSDCILFALTGKGYQRS